MESETTTKRVYLYAFLGALLLFAVAFLVARAMFYSGQHKWQEIIDFTAVSMNQLENGEMPSLSEHANRDERERIEALKNIDLGDIQYTQSIDTFVDFYQFYVHTDNEQLYFCVVEYIEPDTLTLVNLEPRNEIQATDRSLRKIVPNHD